MSVLSVFTNTLTGGMSGLAVYGILFMLGLGVGAYGGYRLEYGNYEKVVAANAQAQAIAVQKAKDIQAATDKVALNAAVAEAQAQQKIVVEHEYQTQEIVKYVPVNPTCVTYGIVRLLDAAGFGTDPANSPDAPGKPDAACTGLSVRALVANIIDNYSTAVANAEQLNALEAWVNATVAASKGY